jgi:methylenetetrahydrofolate reductase (NADPH)
MRGVPSIMNGWSLEATLPKPDEIETLARRLAPGTEVFLSTLPHVSLDQQIETARSVRANGLEPVLHIAARYFASRTELVGYLARANREARADRVLVIAGDLDRPRGAFDSALSLIASGLLADYGMGRVGIAGYPEGHPKISGRILDSALDEKLAAIRAAGLAAEIVSQFCFDAAPIAGWVTGVRARWPDVPIRVGLAGPASARALLKFALRCGVAAPLRGFGRNLSTAGQLLRTVSPEPIVAVLDEALPASPPASGVSVHFFSFGGLARTVEWVAETYPTCLATAGPGDPNASIRAEN